MNLIALNKNAYNRIAGHFSLTRTRLWPEFNEFTPYVRPGQRVLDWGCGNGRLVYMLENKNIGYFGVDQSVELLKHAKKLHKSAIAQGQAHFYLTAGRNKKFPENYFDLVFMVASFFHLPSERSRLALLKKTWRELKPGGRLCMTLWNLESSWAAKKKPEWKKLAENDWLIPWKDPKGKVLAKRYYHHFTEAEIKKLLQQSGFIIERIVYSDSPGWTDNRGGRNLIVIAKKK